MRSAAMARFCFCFYETFSVQEALVVPVLESAAHSEEEAAMEAQLQAAKEQQDFQAAVSQLRDLALGKHPNDAESIKIKEQAIQASISL